MVKGRQYNNACTVYACVCYASITKMNSTLNLDSRQNRQSNVSVTEYSTDQYAMLVACILHAYVYECMRAIYSAS